MRVLSAGKLKAFHLAGMTGSFKHAAHLLSISPSAVSARVRSLESDLGVRLFTRGIRTLTLTEAGADYIREVEAAFVSLDMATRELRTRFGQPPRARRENPKRPAEMAPVVSSSSEQGKVLDRDWV
jgi:LysR family transcriptional regulator, glycine cleavage system transcriptional activator